MGAFARGIRGADHPTRSPEGSQRRAEGSRRRETGSRLPAMGQAALCTKVSEQEYLAFERAAEERHEYADGASRNHSVEVAGPLLGLRRQCA